MIHRQTRLPVLLIFLLLSLFKYAQVARAGEIIKSAACAPVGRIVISEDSGIAAGKVLCGEDEIIVGKDLRVFVGCLQGRGSRWLSSGRYDAGVVCAYQRTVDGSCWFKFLLACNRSTESISLISPRSSTVSTSPFLKWKSVQGVEYYEVSLESDAGETFRVKSKNPEVNFAEVYQWKPGNFYRVKIQALVQGKDISEGKFSFRMPSVEEIQELDLIIGSIESSDLPQFETIRLIDSAYMSAGLIYESIDFLEKAFEETGLSKISQILGDRYSAIEAPEQAMVNYSIVLDESPVESEERQFAKEMLMRIEKYQARANFPPIQN